MQRFLIDHRNLLAWYYMQECTDNGNPLSNVFIIKAASENWFYVTFIQFSWSNTFFAKRQEIYNNKDIEYALRREIIHPQEYSQEVVSLR